MNIGLMTWFHYKNYGTVLQAFAMQEILRKYKYKTEFINYLPRGSNFQVSNFKEFYQVVQKKFFSKYDNSSGSAFDTFVNDYFSLSEPYDNYIELRDNSNKYDCIICGSDQIWSPFNFDENLYLNYADENKIISYAPSFGTANIDHELIRTKIKQNIKRFKYLSIREETGKKIIDELCDKKAKVVLDPTLLLNRDDWNKYSNFDLEKKLSNRKYILTYFLGDSNKYYKKIKRLAQKNDLEIINIPVFKNKKINKYNLCEKVGPKEFIALINKAQLVLTDSFHGTIFAINFNKAFYTFKRFKDKDRRGQNSRISDILNKLDLKQRIIDNRIIEDDFSINLTKSLKKLESYRKMSLLFLLNSIEDIEKEEKKLKRQKDEKITNKCSGCGCCKSVCPHKAISIDINENGFYEYSVDKSKCVNCGLCKKVCPMTDVNSNTILKNKVCYSAKLKDKTELVKSASGGVGFALASYLNKKGFYVSGCTYDTDSNSAKHIIIEPNRITDIHKIQGSKYIQSYSADSIEKILKLNNEKVVFFGTPCQVAGLDKLLKLKHKRENVILIDLICHGVPSYLLWNKYIKEITGKYNNSSININFRDKKYGWHDRRIVINGRNFKYVGKDSKDDFYTFFRLGVVDNFSCSECPYRLKSAADLRIGDYWGARYKKDNEGVSIVLSNTRRGYMLLKDVEKENSITVEEHSINDFLKNQYVRNLNPYLNKEKILEELKKDRNLKSIRKEYLNFDEKKDKIYNFYYKIRG